MLRTAAALHTKNAEYLGKEVGAENSLESVNALRKWRFVWMYIPYNQFHKTEKKISNN